MSKRILLLILAAGLTATAWTAEKGAAPKEEKIGVGGGAAIGAIAGGPIGLILGAAFGGWIGDRFHQERSQRLETEDTLEQAQANAESQNDLLYRSESELTDLRSEYSVQQRNYRGALQEALEVQVFFRTGQSTLQDDAERRLSRIAGLVQSMEGFAVVVEGHADARGNEEYNEQLSAGRAAAVRDALIRAGVSADRITSSAEGERHSSASEQDLDALAMERRVNLSIVDQRSNRVAQQ